MCQRLKPLHSAGFRMLSPLISPFLVQKAVQRLQPLWCKDFGFDFGVISGSFRAKSMYITHDTPSWRVLHLPGLGVLQPCYKRGSIAANEAIAHHFSEVIRAKGAV